MTSVFPSKFKMPYLMLMHSLNLIPSHSTCIIGSLQSLNCQWCMCLSIWASRYHKAYLMLWSVFTTCSHDRNVKCENFPKSFPKTRDLALSFKATRTHNFGFLFSPLWQMWFRAPLFYFCGQKLIFKLNYFQNVKWNWLQELCLSFIFCILVVLLFL